MKINKVILKKAMEAMEERDFKPLNDYFDILFENKPDKRQEAWLICYPLAYNHYRSIEPVVEQVESVFDSIDLPKKYKLSFIFEKSNGEVFFTNLERKEATKKLNELIANNSIGCFSGLTLTIININIPPSEYGFIEIFSNFRKVKNIIKLIK